MPPQYEQPRRGWFTPVAAGLAVVLAAIALVVSIVSATQSSRDTAAGAPTVVVPTSLAGNDAPTSSAPTRLPPNQLCTDWKVFYGSIADQWSATMPKIDAAVRTSDTDRQQALRTELAGATAAMMLQLNSLLEKSESGDVANTLRRWRDAYVALYAEVGAGWVKSRIDPLVIQANEAKHEAEAACGVK